MAAYDSNPDANINVAAVCGSEVRIYGDVPNSTERRPLLRTLHFQHHGAAMIYAAEHDDAERVARARRQGATLR